jgi:hypothetical protein
MANGYIRDTEVNQGHIPTIKEENIQAWKQIMMTGCTVVV